MAEDKKTETEVTETEEPKAITAAEMNAAISARERRQEQKLQKQFAELTAKFAELTAPKEPETKADEGATVHPELARLQKRLEAAERAASEERKARETERQQRLADEERSSVESALRAAGISDDIQVRAARALLKEDRKIFRAEDGALRMNIVDKHGSEIDMPISDALREWTKSDTGKRFLPPRAAAGSGASPQQRRAQGEKRTRAQAQVDLVRAMGFNVPDPDEG